MYLSEKILLMNLYRRKMYERQRCARYVPDLIWMMRRAEWLNLFPEIFGRICYDIIGGDSRRGPERLETLSACSSGYYPRD